MIKLIKAILKRNEAEAYTHLANVKWNKECHYKGAQLTYGQHAIVSLFCALYLLTLGLFCIFHAFFPNVKPTFATDRLKRFDKFYENIKKNLRSNV